MFHSFDRLGPHRLHRKRFGAALGAAPWAAFLALAAGPLLADAAQSDAGALPADQAVAVQAADDEPLFDQPGGVASTHVIVRLKPGARVELDTDGFPRLRSPGGVIAHELRPVLERYGVGSIEPMGGARTADRARAARLGLDRWWKVRVPAGVDTHALAAALAAVPGLFELVELDGVGGVAGALPNDPSFSLQYALSNVGQVVGGLPGVADADIDAPEAWELAAGAGEVVIALLDSGVNEHVELAGRILPGINIPAMSGDTTDGCSSHGTHVSGIAAALGDNGIGIAGVHWNAKILPVVVVAPCTGLESYVADGLMWAADQGADIANMSLQYFTGSQYLHDAVLYAAEAGMVMIAATGNTAGSVAYPAKWPETIAVAATDNSDERWSMSNFGPEVDVAAPGWQIYSLTGTVSYGYKNGTSMAVPHVSGIAAHLLSIDPDLTADEVRTLITSTADDVEGPGFDTLTGFGRVNAHAAIQALLRTRATPGDLDLNGVVDSADLGMLLSAWGECVDCELAPCPPDLDNDCMIDGADLAELLANWG